MVAGERGRHLVEAVRRLRPAAEQQERRPPDPAPVEEVEAEAGVVDRDVARAGHAAPLACPATPSPEPRPWPIAWPGAARYRSPVISVAEALRVVLDATPVLGTERVRLSAP